MEDLRLSPDTVPSRYDLRLQVDMAEAKYCGEVRIRVELKRPEEHIHLHLDPVVEVDEARIDQEVVSVERLRWQVLALRAAQQLTGVHELCVRFHGDITWGTKGFNVSQRQGDVMAATHFEPIYARQVFPCFDEPHFKSIFRLAVEVDGFEVISNTPLLRREGGAFEFQPTPLMSVYLLHWTICKLGKVTQETRGHQVSVYYLNPEDASEKCTLACSALDYYEDFFGLAYVLPKLDLIPVHRLKVRAMENWGAITFHAHLLENQRRLEPGEFVRNCRTVCHEISHMWFGNLVTMQWWDDLWLNEGFARFMEHKCLAAIHPEYQLDTLFLKDVLEPMLGHDMLPDTHPVIQQCSDPEQIDNIFDVISYGKGSCIARMLEGLMGEEKFREGIRVYMRQFEYSNATTEQLWQVLDQFGEVSHIMRQWTHLAGHPNLIATYKDSVLRLTQECSGSKDLWPLPLTYLTSTGVRGSVMLQTSTLDLEVGSVAWVKLNLDYMLPIQTLYPTSFLLSMDLGQLSTQDIYGLVMESFYFFRKGLVTYEALQALLVRAAQHCPHISLCRKIAEIIQFFERDLDGRNLFPTQLREFVLATMRPFTQLPNENFYSREARAVSTSLVLAFESDASVVQDCFRTLNSEDVRPEELRHLAKVAGRYAEDLPLPVQLGGEALAIAYNNAGPALIRAMLRSGMTTTLWSHSRPGQVLLQAADAQLDSTTLSELAERLVKNIDSKAELEAVQAHLGGVSEEAFLEVGKLDGVRRVLLHRVGLAV